MGMATDTAMARRARNLVPAFSAAVLVAMALPVSAGEWTITPSVSLNETMTDNVDQVENHRTSSLITDIAPGINIVGTGDRVKLNVDYRLHNLFYSDDSSRNGHQNSLNAAGTLEALENWFYIDANASISQQNLSAFRGATDSSVDTNNSSNTTETSTYRLSPYFKGMLGASTEYELRYNLAKTTTDSSNSYDTTTRGFAARLRGTPQLSRFAWAVDANTQKAEFSNGRENDADLLRGVLTYKFDPQFRVSLIGGRESNDYASIDKKSHTIKGLGLDWSPTDRTLLSASREDRFFGNSDSVSFTHRTARTAWKFRQTKDTVTSTNQTSGSVGTYFDLFDNMFQSAIPDPAARAAFVNAFLQSNGVSPTAQLQGGFMTTGVTLQKRRELSFALSGVRNTVTFAATQSDSENLSQGAGLGWFAGTEFANVNQVRQTGASVNWSHKLTGLSTLTGSLSRLKSKGQGTSSAETDQDLYTVNFLTQVGPKTNVGVGFRRIDVDGTTSYTENAVTGTFSHRF